MVIFWWASVSNATAVTLTGEVDRSWAGCVGDRVEKSEMAIFGMELILGGVLIIRVLGALEVSR